MLFRRAATAPQRRRFIGSLPAPGEPTAEVTGQITESGRAISDELDERGNFVFDNIITDRGEWVFGLPGQEAEALLQAVATWSSDGQAVAGGELSLQAVAEWTSEGSRVAGGDVTARAVATLDGEGSLTAEGDALLQAVTALSADAGLLQDAEANLSAVATFTVDGRIESLAGASLQAVATVSGDVAVEAFLGEAVLQAVAHMAFDPEHNIRPLSWFPRYPSFPLTRATGRSEGRGRSTGVYR